MSAYLIYIASRIPFLSSSRLLDDGSLSAYMPLIMVFVGSSAFSALITYFITRRKVTADTTSAEVDADSKMSGLLKDMQSQNVDLYKKNIELEKANADLTHQSTILTSRLETRDVQLANTSKQLDLLRNLAEQAPITEMLRTQLDAVNNTTASLQAAQNTLSTLLLEKEKTIQELFKTNRDLELQKPPKKQGVS